MRMSHSTVKNPMDMTVPASLFISLKLPMTFFVALDLNQITVLALDRTSLLFPLIVERAAPQLQAVACQREASGHASIDRPAQSALCLRSFPTGNATRGLVSFPQSARSTDRRIANAVNPSLSRIG